MLSRSAKSLFYAFSGPLMRVNGVFYRALRAPKTNDTRVHLGPGQTKYLEGFVNLDANIFTGKADVWVDLRNPLPFRNDSIKAAYSHHMIEHLPNMGAHLAEIYRCLKSGGVYRVAAPHGDSAIAKFIENDAQWFTDFPDKRESIGGKLDNFIYCRQEHLAIMTQSYLEELLKNAGFKSYDVCLPVRETKFPELFSECLATESESDFETPHTLVIEAIK